MTYLTDKEQALTGSILFRSMTARGTSLTGVVSINFDGHAPSQQGFVGKQTLQFSKGPRGGMAVGPSLLLARFVAMRAGGALTKVGQILQTDEAVWILGHNALSYRMVGLQLQLSLSLADLHQFPGSAASAFLLQAFSESCQVIGFGADGLAGKEVDVGRVVAGIRCHRKVALSYVYSDDVAMLFRGRVSDLNGQAYKQVELLLGLLVPELGRADSCALVKKGHMFVIARVRKHHTPRKGEDAHVLLSFEAVIPLVVVGQGRRDIFWGLVKSLVAFLGASGAAGLGILLRLCPQALVGGPDLTWNITGHLGRQMIRGTYLIIARTLQQTPTTGFAMCKSVLTEVVQGIPIRQLCAPKRLKLVSCRVQFQFCGYHLLHGDTLAEFHKVVKRDTVHEDGRTHPICRRRNAPSSPCVKRRGLLSEAVDGYMLHYREQDGNRGGIDMQKEDIERYLADLGQELQDQGLRQPIRLLLIGGAFMLTQLGSRRTTNDIDVLLIDIDNPTTSSLYQTFKMSARMVARQNNIPLTWINDMIGDFLRDVSQIPQGTLWRTYGLLEVYIPEAAYILALKLLAGRQKDQEDCQILCQRLHINTRTQAQEVVDRYISDKQVQQLNHLDKTLGILFP